MKKKINILHLEDSFTDAEIIRKIVEREENVATYFVVNNKKDYLSVLDKESIDLILSAYNLPGFKGNEALKVDTESMQKPPLFLFQERWERIWPQRLLKMAQQIVCSKTN